MGHSMSMTSRTRTWRCSPLKRRCTTHSRPDLAPEMPDGRQVNINKVKAIES
jgi:hypothetical protein